jgi:hypothetical protein
MSICILACLTLIFHCILNNLTLFMMIRIMLLVIPTCHIVKGIVFKSDVDDHVPILLVNHVLILLMNHVPLLEMVLLK